MIRLLQNNGFIIIRQRGSHVQLLNLKSKRSTTVPLHNKDLSKGLEQAILKQAGIK
ncbi:MAG TPA: type II toxin-antitoxin system HicA family toxin [Anaerovoracaceae bacterium]|nr:type II toxin-antitoxin system HicA family toxin [Anaerovoracaceae bacterium]